MSNIFSVEVIQSRNQKVKSFYNKALKELIDFYGINWVDNPPEIYLVDNRKDFDIISGYKTNDWEVGKCSGFNKVIVFSPNSYEKESIHKYSDDEYFSLIKHELSHLFYNILSKGYGPVWLDEGFAIYTSGELARKERPKEFKNFMNYYSNGGKGVYEEAGFVVESLIKEYGKERVLEFIKILPSVDNEEDFNKEFGKFFDKEIKSLYNSLL